MLWFRKKSAPEKTSAEYLTEAETALLTRLIDPDDIEAKSPPTIERLHRRLLALERLYDVQAKVSQKAAKKRFIETPAGASLLTGILTITASQMPAYIQAMEGRLKTEVELLKPIVEAIAKDTSIDLDTRLALVRAIQYGDTRYQTVEDIKIDVARRKQRVDAASKALSPGEASAPAR